MASTYTDLLKIELIGDGEQSGSWGTTTNSNLKQSVEHSIAGVLSIAITGDVTLTTGDGPQTQADNQARQACIIFTGSAAGTVTVPATQKIYHIYNNSSAIITLRISGGTTDFVLAAATSYLIACTGSAWHALNDDKVHFTAAGTVSNTSGNITVDSAADIILDADGANVTIKDGGTAIGDFSNSSSDFVITSSVQDKDIIFKGDDGGSAITALTLDMSAAGAATFNAGATFGGVVDVDSGVTIDNITIDGTEIDLSSGDLTVDVAGDIILDADGGDVFVKDAGTTFGSFTNTSGNLIIKSGTTTAATFSGANVTLAGTVTGTTFSGSGASLTSLPAANLTGTAAAISGVNLTSLNASNLGSGTIPDARFPSTLPAASGENLTDISASEVLQTFDAIGSMILACTAATTAVNTTYAGSLLFYDYTGAAVSEGASSKIESFNITALGSSSLTGTWRCLGKSFASTVTWSGTESGSETLYFPGLFQRIS